MKIITIVGARPQFIKAAAVSRVIREVCTEKLVHTGQHYDTNMSDVFFEELDIPKPDYNLHVGSGSHAEQTANMLIGIEKILLEEKPDYILVYGDTNSTLAGALAAIKIHVPVIHVEAGLRSYNMNMPEEINRILTDRISRYLICPTETAKENLEKEGVKDGIYVIGDVMCDAVLYYQKKLSEMSPQMYFDRLVSITDEKIEHFGKWYLATIHRAENTDTQEKIEEILAALSQLEEKVIFPVHPRTKRMVLECYHKNHYSNLVLVEPIGYLDMLYFTNYAKKVVTDSGGLQKEAYIMKTPCITVREQTEWVETLQGNWNILAHPKCEDILEKIQSTKIDEEQYANHYGDGNAAVKLKELILSFE